MPIHAKKRATPFWHGPPITQDDVLAKLKGNKVAWNVAAMQLVFLSPDDPDHWEKERDVTRDLLERNGMMEQGEDALFKRIIQELRKR